jgi:hypothetical protein
MSSVVISGDTSGSITLQAPAVAGTNTITLPASTGTMMVSGNMPAFRATLSVDQALTTATYTKVLFNTETFDTNNNFASSTFTPTVAGYYQLTINIQATFATFTRFIVVLYKNGAVYERGYDGGSFNNNSVSSTYLAQANGTTDYFDAYVYMAGTTLAVISGTTGSSFGGELIRTT